MRRLVLSVILTLGLAVCSGAVQSAWAASPQAQRPASAPKSTVTKPAAKDKPAAKPSHHAAGRKDSTAARARGSSPFSAFAIGQGRGPLKIASDKLSLEYKEKTVVFTGHVRALQIGGGQLTCDNLKVVYGDTFRDMKEMVAEGNVRISEGTRWVTGDHAVMDQALHTVVLTGSPVVHDGTDQITGSKITVHLDTGRSVVENARAVIFPKQSETTDNVMGSGAP